MCMHACLCVHVCVRTENATGNGKCDVCIKANLHSQTQRLVGYCAQTTKSDLIIHNITKTIKMREH